MVKDGSSSKASTNRMRSKSLQKLKWYCQMCQKQCRDENGMRCHMKSEGHLRAMRLFAENPGKVLSEFSGLFLKGFLSILHHRHGTKRVLANTVYQEYIGDKNHIHMNATAWSSLAGLCRFLGRQGKCIVDETEKGWYLQYIDNDPRKLAKQSAIENQLRVDHEEEERIERVIERQIAAALERGKRDDEDEAEDEEDDEAGDFHREEGEKISLFTSLFKRPTLQRPQRSEEKEEEEDQSNSAGQKRKREILPFDDPEDVESSRPHVSSSQSNTSALHQLMKEEEERKAFQRLRNGGDRGRSSAPHVPTPSIPHRDEVEETKEGNDDRWLRPGIVVKILNKRLSNGLYYKAKGVVEAVRGEGYIAEIRVLSLSSSASTEIERGRIRIDQEELETVIPKVGKDVLVLCGSSRGTRGILRSIHENDYNCDVIINEGSEGERLLRRVEYEDICKVYDPEEWEE